MFVVWSCVGPTIRNGMVFFFFFVYVSDLSYKDNARTSWCFFVAVSLEERKYQS